MITDFRGRATKLEDVDLPRIGHIIGVGEDVIHAIMDVEAPKSGFDAIGRPRILYEPHVMYRCLPPALKESAVAQGVAYKTWRPGTYGPESAQYGKLEHAMLVHAGAAMKACSWGRSQILGENHVMAGYASVQEMVEDFCDDEDNHIEAMARFLKAKHLDVHLRRIDGLKRASTAADWAPVAEGYNGSGYATNSYHVRLADRHNWWRARPDTPWSPLDAVEAAERQNGRTAEPIPPSAAPIDPPTAVIVSDEPIAKPGFWARFWTSFKWRTTV